MKYIKTILTIFTILTISSNLAIASTIEVYRNYTSGLTDEIDTYSYDDVSNTLGAVLSTNTLLGAWNGIAEHNGTYYGLGLNGEIFESPGNYGGSTIQIGQINSTGYRGITYDGSSWYGLFQDGRIFQNPGNFGGTQTFIGSLASTGYNGITYDGSNWYGLFNDGRIFMNPGNFGGIQTFVGDTLIGTVSTGNGLEYIPTAVPLPAAAWLFGSAMLGLFGVGRMRKKAV